jgi:hypothetical protein
VVVENNLLERLAAEEDNMIEVYQGKNSHH